MTKQANSYADNYEKLESINNRLQNEQDNPNIIDELAKMLEQASKSYMACKRRIDAAEKLVMDFENKAFNDEESS